MKKFIVRLRVAYRVLFRRYDHWFLFNLDNENMVKLCKEENFETHFEYHGLQKYGVYKAVQMIANSYDEIDMALMKAEFEAEAHLYNIKNQQQ